jgi:cyclopropane-fatty-acyl-phospholipid synthase
VRGDLGIELAERGLVPDAVLRRGIRGLLAAQLARARRRGDDTADAQEAFRRHLADGPIAVETATANAQHYEIPPEFFAPWLGPRMKYSAALWPEGVTDLAAAEEAMLDLSCRRAGLAPGMRVLELGCGWGSLTLWMAERYPGARITALTNSASQAAWVGARAAARGLSGVAVVRANVAEFDTAERFDRVVTVEMMEHLRNWEALLRRVAGWLAPEGRMFVHVFSHRDFAYLYETDDTESWMARHFFTGGMMPSHDLLPAFDRDLATLERWVVDGTHYQKTLEAWLVRLDAARGRVLPVLAGAYGGRQAMRQLRRWRIFLLACTELFGWNGGATWRVSHYLLGRTATRSPGRPSTS